MPLKLSEQEIKQRLIRLRNLERLYAKQVQSNASLKEEARRIREQIVALTVQFEAVIEAQTIRIAELERMVFGRKQSKDKTPPDDGVGSDDASESDSSEAGGSPSSSKSPRSKDSYRRPVPPAEMVTGEEYVAVTECGHCHGPLIDLAEHIRYIEDIVLAALNEAGGKTATKLTIQRGYCPSCGKYTSGRDLRGQAVELGPNVRLLVGYLTTILDLTYSQVVTILKDVYGFELSEGEIAGVLAKAGRTFRPEYEALKTRIRSGPGAHLDESPYHIQDDDNSGYAWAMASSTTTDVIFALADSRGKGNAKSLLGPDYDGVRISDGYGGYKYLPGLHQQCWAHMFRIIRDLSEVSTLPESKRVHVKAWHVQFKDLYATLRDCLTEPFDEDRRAELAGELLGQVHELCQPDSFDPKKLANLKAFMLNYDHALFTCLLVPGIPADNNRAERVIRKLVLKRKKSFGCKSNKGAKALEVMLSVCWSTWYREGRNFFPAMQALVAAA